MVVARNASRAWFDIGTATVGPRRPDGGIDYKSRISEPRRHPKNPATDGECKSTKTLFGLCICV